MYIGERSNRLDISEKDDVLKKDDSFYIKTSNINCNGLDTTGDVPINDITEPSTGSTTNIPYFLVNYGDQNQSLFKDIKLDQEEFTETNEGLQIIEDLSNQNSNTSIGQNLFDIYCNRSYTAEIEMLGCAQIQPFMYFQLNNIPMFKGAYTIINTTHRITPNNMTTSFTGVRIRNTRTKMVDRETLFYNLIGNLDDVNTNGIDVGGIIKKIGNSATKTPNSTLKQNQVEVNEYLKAKGYSKNVVAGIMGNIQAESSFRIGVEVIDVNNKESFGLIQWNFGSYPQVFALRDDATGNKFNTVKEQLDYLTTKMSVFTTFIDTVRATDNEQYTAFLFAHFVEVCCGCASTPGYTTLSEIFTTPYIKGWRCPYYIKDTKIRNTTGPIFRPFIRSEFATQFLARFNDSKDTLYWKP
jgi:hypothetical protein